MHLWRRFLQTRARQSHIHRARHALCTGTQSGVLTLCCWLYYAARGAYSGDGTRGPRRASFSARHTNRNHFISAARHLALVGDCVRARADELFCANPRSRVAALRPKSDRVAVLHIYIVFRGSNGYTFNLI